MAITSSQSKAPASVTNRAQGAYLDSAGTPAAATLTVGFTARYVLWLNLTDRISYEWFEGMTAAHALKTAAAGTRTAETSDGITVSGMTVSIDADIILQNKQYYWVAIG